MGTSGSKLKPFLVRFFPMSALLISIMSLVAYVDAFNRVRSFTDIERVKLEFVTNRVSLEMSTVFKDLYDLMHRRTLAHYLEKEIAPALDEVKESYLMFSDDNHQYDQIRLLSKKGREVLRINSKDEHSWAVPAQELQSKSDRYYFVNSVNLPPGEIYTSPLDLNIEFGQMEIPRKPMLRVAAPLRNASGEVVAVLVLNYLGDVLLNTLHNRLEFAGQTVMLLNSDGYWLDGGDDNDWAFMFPERTGQTFAASHPELWRAIGSRPSGQITEAQPRRAKCRRSGERVFL